MVELTDGVIRLRPVTLADAEDHLSGEDDLTVRFLSGGRSTIETVTAWIERNRRSWEESGPVRCFGILDLTTNRLVGMVEANLDLPSVRRGVGNISYVVYPPFRGKGCATRAVRLVTSYLVARTDADVAMIQADPDNEASVRVALGAGFRFVGQRVSPDGSLHKTFVLPLRDFDRPKEGDFGNGS